MARKVSLSPSSLIPLCLCGHTIFLFYYASLSWSQLTMYWNLYNEPKWTFPLLNCECCSNGRKPHKQEECQWKTCLVGLKAKLSCRRAVVMFKSWETLGWIQGYVGFAMNAQEVYFKPCHFCTQMERKNCEAQAVLNKLFCSRWEWEPLFAYLSAFILDFILLRLKEEV